MPAPAQRAALDPNRKPSLLAVSNIDFSSLVAVAADPATGGLIVSGSITASNPSIGTTGAAVPGSATYVAGNKSGLTTGLLIGSQTSANSLAVVIASDQGAVPISGAISFTAPQHVIVDSGTITTVSAVTAITNALPAGSNVIGHVITDANSVTAATLSAETTKVIGVVRTADGSGNLLTTNSTTYVAKNALDNNLLGTLGTAFSTAGKVDVKGADGDVFVRQTTASNLNATVVGTGTFAVQATPVTQADTFMLGGVNIKEINAVTPLMGNGTTGTGSLRVTVASDNSAVSGMGAGATGAAVPANAIYHGLNPQTALPTAATSGNLVGATSDKYGRQVFIPGTMRDLIGTQTTTITSSTSETTIITAAANIFNDIILLTVTNTSATGTRVDLRDTTAGSVIASLYVPATDMRGFAIGKILPQTTVNTNWTITCGTSVSDIRIFAVFEKNK